MKLSTLIGIDDHPGEVPGCGAVHAFLARSIVAQQTRGHWRYAVCDDHGHLTRDGVIHARPTVARPTEADRAAAHPADGPAGAHLAEAGRGGAHPAGGHRIGAHRDAPRSTGGPSTGAPGTSTPRGRGAASTGGPITGAIVEIAVPQTLLEELRDSPAKAGPWASVIADILRQSRIEREDDPRRRTPAAELRRHVQIRDRVCAAPGCRIPATACDIDHREDYADGGPTLADNLLPLCRHDHRLKHDGRWTLAKDPGGGHRWSTPNGLTFRTRPPSIIADLPPPHPRN